MSLIDKFKVDETAPFFPIGPMGPTGSYSSGSFKNKYVLKFKDNETKSVIRTSGILSSSTVPPTISPITILRYSTNAYNGSTFDWSGVTWTLNSTLPNYSWTANAVNFTSALNQLDQNYEFLTSVVIGGSVTSIGANAFNSCTHITSVTIPASVTSIGNGAFMKNYDLPSVTIPNSVTSIGDGAFETCTSLTSITIPNSVTYIGASAFIYCDVLTSIKIPASVTSIGTDAFGGGPQEITTVTIKNNQLPGIPSPEAGVTFYGRTVNTILP